MKKSWLCSIPLLMSLSICAVGSTPAQQPKAKNYNVIFIAVDDLNDWVGCMGGNPQAITPNMDKLAAGGLVMNKAYAPSTVCCPSRSAILTGKHATHTGVYGNRQNLKHAAKAKNLITLPEYFGSHGYYTLSSGKIFHKHGDQAGTDEGQWAFQEFEETGGSNGKTLWEEHPEGADAAFKWGAVEGPTEKTKDFLTCKWAADQLERDFDGKPFFMAVGVSKPHLTWHVPQEFFDLYPLDKIEPVGIKRDDLDDIVGEDGKPVFGPSSDFLAIEKAGMHKNAQRAYLAAISYADHCMGVLLDALENSKYADNTIVMLWGDHGWFLCEKLRYGKTQLWEESARVPFIVKVPGVTPAGVKCEGVVNLIDMYPTLIELCGLPPNQENDGRSFAKLLANPTMAWIEPTLTTYQHKNHSLTDGRYRYTWYGGKPKGGEELYDHATDPLEHTNLAKNPEYKEVIARLKTYLPTHNEPDSPINPDNDLKSNKENKGKKGGNKES